MKIRSTREIYRLVEKYLKKSEEPQTCVDLMDNAEVEKAALEEFGGDKRHATNKLSDTLGFMWRRGILTRYPAGGESGQMARFAYTWSYKGEDAQTVSKSIPAPTVVRPKTGVIVKETPDGGVSIEFDKFYIHVVPK